MNVFSIEGRRNTFDAVIYINMYRILMILVPFPSSFKAPSMVPKLWKTDTYWCRWWHQK
jgi:hypothetical protein